MSSLISTSKHPVAVGKEVINLAMLTPVVQPSQQGVVTIQSSLEAQDHGSQNASRSSSVRSKIQLIATLLALSVRTAPMFSKAAKFLLTANVIRSSPCF